MSDLENAWENEEDLQKAEVSEQDKQQYDNRFKQNKGFFKRAVNKGRKLLAGENLAGKIGAKAKDMATRFGLLPKWINEATDEIGDSLKQKPNTMYETKLEKVKRFLKQKSTQSAIALIATVVSAIFAGVEINPEVLTQSLLGIATALGALWVSVNTIIDMFRDEDAK